MDSKHGGSVHGSNIHGSIVGDGSEQEGMIAIDQGSENGVGSVLGSEGSESGTRSGSRRDVAKKSGQ